MSKKFLFGRKNFNKKKLGVLTFIALYIINKYGRNAGRIKIKNRNTIVKVSSTHKESD